MSLRALVVCVVLAVAAAPAAAATQSDDTNDVIVPGKGMAGVRMGMSVTSVADALGKATSTEKDSDARGRFTDRTYSKLELHVVLRARNGVLRVDQVYTTGKKLHTRQGVQVGSTEKAVRDRVDDVVCGRVPGKGARRACQVGRAVTGATVTSFQIEDGKVSRVAIGVIH